MSRLSRLVLPIHMIVSLVLGGLLLLIPGRLLMWLGWAPIDPIISRILGGALLAMAWGDMRVWLRGGGAEIRLWAEVQLAFAVLGGIGVLRHLVVAHWPAMVWILFGVLAAFALAWLAVLVGEGRSG